MEDLSGCGRVCEPPASLEDLWAVPSERPQPSRISSHLSEALLHSALSVCCWGCTRSVWTSVVNSFTHGEGMSECG
jgi:hypothetical protein